MDDKLRKIISAVLIAVLIPTLVMYLWQRHDKQVSEEVYDNAVDIALNRDGTHLDSGVGRYIAALTFMAALTGADISEVEWAPTNIGEDVRDVDAAARAVAIESVINALKNPYEVTQSQYTVAP